MSEYNLFWCQAIYSIWLLWILPNMIYNGGGVDDDDGDNNGGGSVLIWVKYLENKFYFAD